MKTKIQTAIYPFNVKENQYINIIVGLIESNGYSVVDFESIKASKKSSQQTTIVNLNWFESIGNCGRVKAVLLVIRQMFRVIRLKHYNVKIIYTMHNMIAHDTKFPFLNKFMMDFMCRSSDRIAVLSELSMLILEKRYSTNFVKRKVRLVSHPSYIGVYPTAVNKLSGIDDWTKPDCFKVIFSGFIKPYKNIELIIKVANKLKDLPIQFVIAGRPVSEDYSVKLRSLSDTPNIFFDFQFIPDSQIVSYYHWADISLIPLSITSSLNSGSAILAYSMGKTVIAPEIGTTLDFPIEYQYLYRYKNDDEHLEIVRQTVLRAFNDWKDDRKSFDQKGLLLKKYINDNFGYTQMKAKYSALYSELAKSGGI